MKIIDIKPNTSRTNSSPYIYEVTFISKDGTIRKAISKQSHLEAWLQELHQVPEFHLLLNKYQVSNNQITIKHQETSQTNQNHKQQS